MGILLTLLVGVLTFIVLTILSNYIGKARPKSLSTETGRIGINSSILLVWYGYLSISLTTGLFLIFEQWGNVYALMLGAPIFIISLVLLVLTWPQLQYRYDVIWTASFLEGPNSGYKTISKNLRVRMAWTDIRKLERPNFNFWVLEDEDGQKICFNGLYSGHSHFFEALSKYRPDLR